jgi:beta-N-acetylhexosaminidase
MTSPANPYDGSIERFKTAAASGGVSPLLATDEEGGIVQRFRTIGILPSPQDVARGYTPAQAERLIASHGKQLKSIGLDMVLGPLADVAPAGGQSPLGSRVFSDSPNTVSQYAGAYVQGWQKAGLLPTIKHFPGMGSATGNTDFGVATTPPLSSLASRDFVPYKNLAASGTAVMVGNQNVPGWFTGPASLSPIVNQYLRQTLGYKNNLVVTDSLLAHAVSSSTPLPQAVVAAIAAGNDIALVVDPDVSKITPEGNKESIISAESALKQAVAAGTISRHKLAQSVVRKLSAQGAPVCAAVNQLSSHTAS